MSARTDSDWVPGAQQALDGLATALADADLDALLVSEGQLSEIAARLTTPSRLATPLGRDDRDRLEALQRTLGRCRRLGASLSDIVRIAHAAQGGSGAADEYGPHGAPRAAETGGGFRTRV